MSPRRCSEFALPLAVLLLSPSCGGRDATNPQRTATEIFRLRSECTELGKKIQGDQNGYLFVKMAANYDPKTNRCYVEVTTVDRGEDNILQDDHTLYDGQTGEVLASSRMRHGVPPVRAGGAKASLMTLPKGDDASYKAVEDFIAKMMADDRTK